jgi:hypothetical protein
MTFRAFIVVTAIIAAGTTGCGKSSLFAVPAAAQKPKPCTVRIEAPPSAVAVLVHRNIASSRAELDAVLLAAQPNEHIFLLKAATGKLVGAFTTPPGAVLASPPPPPPLPAHPTQVQTYAHSQEIDTYLRALQRERTQLHLWWLARLANWARYVMSKVTTAPWAHRGPHLASEVPGLIRGLTVAGASITSLNNVPGNHLGNHVVVAVLGLEEVPVNSPPPLPSGLQGATIVVAGFTGNSRQEATWRADLSRDGARTAVLLTPFTDSELPVVVAPVLSQGIHHHLRLCADH